MHTSNAVVASLFPALVWSGLVLSFMYINPNRVKKKEGISMDVNCEFVFTCLMPRLAVKVMDGEFLTDCVWPR